MITIVQVIFKIYSKNDVIDQTTVADQKKGWIALVICWAEACRQDRKGQNFLYI